MGRRCDAIGKANLRAEGAMAARSETTARIATTTDRRLKCLKKKRDEIAFGRDPAPGIVCPTMCRPRWRVSCQRISEAPVAIEGLSGWQVREFGEPLKAL